jgi:hypothetical protein
MHAHILEGTEGDGSGQGTERKQGSEGYSQTGVWRMGEVRTQKESERARGNHLLERAGGGTSQDTEVK